MDASFADIVAAPPPKPVQANAETSERHDAETSERNDVKTAKPNKARYHVSVYVTPELQHAVKRLALDLGPGKTANDLYVEGIRLVFGNHGISPAEFDRLNRQD